MINGSYFFGEDSITIYNNSFDNLNYIRTKVKHHFARNSFIFNLYLSRENENDIDKRALEIKDFIFPSFRVLH